MVRPGRWPLTLLTLAAVWAAPLRGQFAAPAASGSAPSASPSTARIDRHGDPLPEGALARLGTVRLRHGSSAHGVALSGDGRRLASAGEDGAVYLWDGASGKEIRQVAKLATPARAVAVSADGKWVAAENTNNLVLIGEVATGRIPINWYGNQGTILALAFSPDGQKLAAGGADRTVRVFLMSTRAMRTLGGHQDDVRGLSWSRDGRRLASASADGTVGIWDAAEYREIRRIDAHAGGVVAVALSPDGKVVAAAGGNDRKPDPYVRLWDADTGKEVGTLSAPGALALAFTPDGKTLLTGDGDGAVRVWDVGERKERRRFAAHFGAVAGLALSRDGKVLATGGHDGALRLWETATGKDVCPQEGYQGEVSGVAFAPDGKTLAGVGRDGSVRLWDVAEAREVRRFAGHTGGAFGVRFAAEGRWLVSGCGDGAVRVWDVSNGKEVRTLAPRPDCNRARSLSVAPDGYTLAVAWGGGKPGAVTLWDVSAGKEVRQFASPAGAVTAVALSPDGKTLTWGGVDRRIHLEELGGGRARVIDLYAEVNDLAFSPDGRLLASASGEGAVGLWDAVTGKEVRPLERFPGGVRALAFSSDGKTLVGAGGEGVFLWEVATGKPRGRFAGLRGTSGSCAVAPDGRTVATGGTDSAILIWDLTGGAFAGTKSAKLTPEALDNLWEELGDADAAKAYRARWQLAAVPNQTVSLLRERVKPVPHFDPTVLRRLIADLDGNDFAIREKAATALETMGELAEAELRKVLDMTASAEVFKRAKRLLDRMGPVGSDERLRALRAVEVLEEVNTAEARRLMEALAGGGDQARLTVEAREALARMSKSRR